MFDFYNSCLMTKRFWSKVTPFVIKLIERLLFWWFPVQSADDAIKDSLILLFVCTMNHLLPTHPSLVKLFECTSSKFFVRAAIAHFLPAFRKILCLAFEGTFGEVPGTHAKRTWQQHRGYQRHHPVDCPRLRPGWVFKADYTAYMYRHHHETDHKNHVKMVVSWMSWSRGADKNIIINYVTKFFVHPKILFTRWVTTTTRLRMRVCWPRKSVWYPSRHGRFNGAWQRTWIGQGPPSPDRSAGWGGTRTWSHAHADLKPSAVVKKYETFVLVAWFLLPGVLQQDQCRCVLWGEPWPIRVLRPGSSYRPCSEW